MIDNRLKKERLRDDIGIKRNAGREEERPSVERERPQSRRKGQWSEGEKKQGQRGKRQDEGNKNQGKRQWSKEKRNQGEIEVQRGK